MELVPSDYLVLCGFRAGLAHSTECAVLEVACLMLSVYNISFLMSIDLHLRTYESHSIPPKRY